MNVRGVNHIGVPVRDLDETVAWYREMFEIEPEFFLKGEPSTEIEECVQVPGAVINAAYFVIGNVGVEFLEYVQPRGRAFELRNCDVGAVHICFGVDDIHETYERLKAKGVNFNNEPSPIVGGPLDGTVYAYFRDFQGLQFEFFQVPADSPTVPR